MTLSDGSLASLREHGRSRDRLLNRIKEALQAEQRVVAAWLTGSLAHGTADDWSDIDLHLVVDDDQFAQFVADRHALYQRFGQPTLVQSIRANTENPGVHFNLLVYPGALEVDCSIWPQHLAWRPASSRLLFGRRRVPVQKTEPQTPEERHAEMQHLIDFFWAMAVVALKEVGRGYTTGAAQTIQSLTNSFDSLWRYIHRPDACHPGSLARRHRPNDPELTALTPRLGETFGSRDALEVIRQICTEVEQLHSALTVAGVRVPLEMPRETDQLARLAQAAIAHRQGQRL